MADWVHCNVCYCQPGQGRQFCLTNCGHTLCGECQPLAETSTTCKVCKNGCSTILLAAKMKPEVEILFTDPVEVLKKHERQILQVLDFQRNHRKKLAYYNREKLASQTNYLKAMTEKMKDLTEKSQTLTDEMQQLAKENNVLRAENQHLKSIISNTNPGCSGSYMMSRATPHNTSNSLARGFVGSSPSDNRNLMQQSSPSLKRSVDGRGPFQELQNSAMLPPMKLPTRTPPMKHPIQTPPMKLSGFTPPSNVGCGTVTPGPARLSVRTPPSNGRMGIIPPYYGTPYTPVQGDLPAASSTNSITLPSTTRQMSQRSFLINPQDFMTPQQQTRHQNY